MSIDDAFDELAGSLVGFHRTWVVYLGLELGLFERIRDAGPGGIDLPALAAEAGCSLPAVRAWALAAHASEIVDLDGTTARIDPDMATVLLDEQKPDYLGGQFIYSVTASMDHDALAGVMRSGAVAAERPPRYHRAIERLTRQDIGVFFEEALGFLPDLVPDLMRGGDVLDLHCGGGRWLVAMAKRFPATRLVGVEAEPDSVARAMRNVDAAGFGDRIRIEAREVEAIGFDRAFDLVYFQHALHQLADKPVALAAAYRALRPGGRLLVLSWCLPSEPEAYRTAHGELIAGIALDELFQGTPLQTREDTVAAFLAAGIPAPETVELPSDATLFHLRRPFDA
jgi:SAM-dependent methyltransferase